MKILVINCGSSSIKYQLIDMQKQKALAQGLVERIGIKGSILTQKVEGVENYIIKVPMKNHKDAMKHVIDALMNKEHGVIKSLSEISAVGHRIVHGGKYSSSVLVDDKVIKYLNKCVKLAPLHDKPSIVGIEACQELMPSVPMSVVFDTAFHSTMPKKAYMYALPYEFYEKYSIRKYGFHGTSHKFVCYKAAEVMGQDIKKLKIISCHIGGGVSLAAVKNGISVDTTMGFTPLEGVVMGTRCGNIDPAIVTYLVKELKYSVDEVNEIMNKKSGLLGLTNISSDLRDVKKSAEDGNKIAKLALDIFAYSIKKQIGAFAAAMGGVDAIVFTAGIGENSGDTRRDILEGLEFMGIKLDDERNKAMGRIALISSDDSKVKVYAIPTNEELVIAKETMDLLN